MKKIICVAAAILVGVSVAGYVMYGISGSEAEDEPPAIRVIAPDVVMPTKVSRPGCEADDRCYVPAVISIVAGASVSWLNDDSAFHSVTSGAYGAPTGLFDSGYMDPGEVFSHSFDEPGEYAYYCTLHEWMHGRVIVS